MKLTETNKRIVLDHMVMASKMAKIKSLSSHPSVSLEELESAAYMGLVDAATRFDPNTGFKFSSYARLRIEGEMKDYMRNSLVGGRTRLIEDGEEFAEHSHACEEIDLSCLEPNESKIVRLYYFENRCMKEIGVSEGVCESRISQILSLCRKKLKKHMSWRLAK